MTQMATHWAQQQKTGWPYCTLHSARMPAPSAKFWRSAGFSASHSPAFAKIQGGQNTQQIHSGAQELLDHSSTPDEGPQDWAGNNTRKVCMPSELQSLP